MPNTRLQLDYSSASMNYSIDLILEGAITQDQVRAISMNLIDGYQIVAEQVALTSPLKEAMNIGLIDRYDETDHPLTDLGQWESGEPKASDMHTEEPATVSHYTISELAEVIAHATWDQLAASMELEMQVEEFDDEDEYDSPGMS